MKRSAIILVETCEIEAFLAFLRLAEFDHIESIEEDCFLVQFDEDTGLTLDHLRELSLEELYVDFRSFILPPIFLSAQKEVRDYLRLVPDGSYEFSSLIATLAKLSEWHPLRRFKRILTERFDTETLTTVKGFIENDMNASRASKALYLHRNTLSYRLDHFIAQSALDVRTFAGAYAYYLLFS
ncbi:MAG: helix-turn-helix domain-containing protein [Candidatus Izemoplasmatales bacterium]|nr:helix-turn-helix domain-containing protein [Candidatus Izemoplasmatales bacterium]